MKIKLIDSSDVEIDVLKTYNEFKNLRFKNNLYFKADASLINNGALKLDQEHKIVFNNCVFKDGIHFQIYIHNTIENNITIIFKNCVIQEYFDPSFSNNCVINNDPDLKFSIEFYRCILPDLEFEDSKLEHIFFGNCICYASQKSRLLFNNCEINDFQLQNFLGSIFINDQGKSSVHIRYSDDNIYLERSEFNDFVSTLVKSIKPTKIFQLETNYYLNDCKVINFEGIKSGKEKMEKSFNNGLQFFFKEKRFKSFRYRDKYK